MNLSQLYYFHELAETQHYALAAKKLSISQPGLSSAISSLENELGVPLFQRKGRNVQLTAYGQEFQKYVIEALSYIEQGISIMKEYSNSISGTIRVGCIPTLLNDYLPSIIYNYHQQYEQADFQIHFGISKEVVEGVLSKQYDVGFCSKIDLSPDLVFVPVSYQEIIAISTSSNPIKEDNGLICKEDLLSQERILSYRESLPIGKVIKSLFKDYGLSIHYKFDDELSIGGLVGKTNHVGICADTPFLNQFPDLKKYHFTDIPKSSRLIYMCYNKTALHTSIMESFLNHVVVHELNLPDDL